MQFSQFGCDCSFLISTAESVLPPIEWEPCKEITAVACEQMKPDPRMTKGHSWIFPHGFYARADGSFEMSASRFDSTAGYYVFWGSDGHIRKGMTGCISPDHSMRSSPPWVNDGVYSVDIYPSNQGTEHGLLAGRMSEPLPSLVRRLPDAGPKSSSWAVSPEWVVRSLSNVASVTTWLSADAKVAYAPASDPDGLPGYLTDVRGGAVFVDVQGNGQAGQMVWTEATGIEPLVRTFGDASRAVMRWGTDGRDMVWLYGDGGLVDGTPYLFKNTVVKTAPYTLDAAEVAKSERVIGPNPIGQGAIPAPFKVGCGYAATLSSDSASTVNGPAIVRLSDGVWWKIVPNVVPYASEAMGVSCEHAYFAAPDGTPIRIPLSSLPPGGMAGW